MMDRKKFTQHLYKNFGLISFIIGVSFFIFGMLNFATLPHFYESQSGSPSFDGLAEIIVNAGLWLGFCILLVLNGHTLYFFGKDLEKIEIGKKGLNILHFFLIAVFIAIGLAIYLVLLLMNVVNPIQFFPNILFVGDVMLLDLSPFFNAVLLYLLLSVILRVTEKFVKYGKKLGAMK